MDKYGIVIDYDGDIWRTINEKFHREDGPAVEFFCSGSQWYRHGRLHREDGPAVICQNGTKIWYLNGYAQEGLSIEDS